MTTINALYYDPTTGDVLDYHDGVKDLRARRLRMIGDPADRYREARSDAACGAVCSQARIRDRRSHARADPPDGRADRERARRALVR